MDSLADALDVNPEQCPDSHPREAPILSNVVAQLGSGWTALRRHLA
jgi:hypothetical protein